MMKNVQSGIYLYWIGNWIGSFPLCCFLDWLIFLLKNVQSGKSMYLIWNWIGLFLDDMIWWWWYDGEPTYWDLELDWLISLLTFMIKNFQSGMSTYLIGNWIGLFLGSHLMSEHWYDGEPMYLDLELDLLISLFIFIIKHVQNGIINNHVLDWKLDWVISVLISVILYM